MSGKWKEVFFRNRFIKVVCVISIFGVVMTAGCGAKIKRTRFAFGIVADVQYGDKDPEGKRYYRDSIKTLAQSSSYFNDKHIDMPSYFARKTKASFVIQLGDLIDGGPTAEADLDTVLTVFNKIKAKKYHVLGNHDFAGIDRKTVLQRLRMKRPYYDFRKGKWRFIVLDTMDISVSGGWPEDSVNYLRGKEFLDGLSEQGAANAEDWNGGIGNEQKRWLEGILRDATRRKQKVVVFGHNPLVPAGERYTLWNSAEIVGILESYDCVVAYINGHRHSDDYVWENNIYYVTIEGMVESPDKEVYAMVWVYDDRLEIHSSGKVPRLTLPFASVGD